MNHIVCYTLEKMKYLLCLSQNSTIGPYITKVHIDEHFSLSHVIFIWTSAIILFGKKYFFIHLSKNWTIGPYVGIEKYNIYITKYLFSFNGPYCLLHFRKMKYLLCLSQNWTIGPYITKVHIDEHFSLSHVIFT